MSTSGCAHMCMFMSSSKCVRVRVCVEQGVNGLAPHQRPLRVSALTRPFVSCLPDYSTSLPVLPVCLGVHVYVCVCLCAHMPMYVCECAEGTVT